MTATQHISIGVLLVFGISLLSIGGAKLSNGNASSTSESRGTITDVDGNVYMTIPIGPQVWMVENLATTSYRDGTRIPRVEDDDSWSSVNTGAYCRPALESSLERQAYGLLYNFHAVSDSRELCPEGWHVPTAAEWRRLIDFLGGVDVAGARMKDPGTGSWRIQVPGASNESGFSALPAGGRGRFGGAGEAGDYATWWSSTPHDSLYAWHWGLHPDKHEIRANPGHVQSGFSVRCVKEQSGP